MGEETKVTNQPWSVMRPQKRGQLGGAWDWYQSGVGGNQMPFSSVADFTPMQKMGQNLAAMKAYFGSPMVNQGSRLASSTINGDFVNPQSNPYLGKYFQQGAEDMSNTYLNNTMPMLRSTAQQAGMGNSTADALLKGQAMRGYNLGLSNLSTNIYGGAYKDERNNQNQMMNTIPSFYNIENQDLNTLQGIGQQNQQQAQSYLNEIKQMWDTRQAAPYTRLAQYGNLISPLFGQGASQITSQGGSPGLMSYLQPALSAGLGIGSLMMGNPMGAMGVMGAMGGGGGGGMGFQAPQGMQNAGGFTGLPPLRY